MIVSVVHFIIQKKVVANCTPQKNDDLLVFIQETVLISKRLPSSASTLYSKMSSTGDKSKSGLHTSVIDLTQMDSVIVGIEKEYSTLLTKIGDAESILRRFRVRVASIRKLPGHQVKAENLPLQHHDAVNSICGPEGVIVNVNASYACPASDPVFNPDFDRCESESDLADEKDGSAVVTGGIQYLNCPPPTISLTGQSNTIDFGPVVKPTASEQDIQQILNPPHPAFFPTGRSNTFDSCPVVNCTASELDFKETLKKPTTCWKNMESLMSVPSTGKFGEGEGGVYQTPKPTLLLKLLIKIHPHVSSILNDFPHLKESSVAMIDAGAGMHIPGVLGAVLGGYQSIGLEIDENRTAILPT